MRRQLFEHHSQVPPSWMQIAPDFTFQGDPKMASSDTGAFLYDPVTLIMMQTLRDICGHSVKVNSWYRSPLYNARVGGAPLSEHLEGRAVDVSTRGRDRLHMYRAAQQAGWTSFGFYNTFMHLGQRSAQWFGSQQAKQIWAPVLAKTQTDIYL